MLVAVKASLEDLKDRVAASESAQADLEDRSAAAQTWRACEVFFPRRCERVAGYKKVSYFFRVVLFRDWREALERRAMKRDALVEHLQQKRQLSGKPRRPQLAILIRYLFHCIRFCEILTFLGHGGSGTKFSALPRACVEHVPHAISGHPSSLEHQHGVHLGRHCGEI